MPTVNPAVSPLRSDLRRDTLNDFNHEALHYIQSRRGGFESSKAKASQMVGLSGYNSLAGLPPLSASFREAQDDIEALLCSYHRGGLHSPMSAEEPMTLTSDPMVDILAAFYLIPDDYQSELFEDFRGAVEAHDLRRLLDAISDWAATAQLYDHPTLAKDLQEAIGGRKGVADWLPG